MKLGERIYRLRTERNMSQGDLANALDVSRQSVSKWENDSAVPELDKLVKLSELFGISLDALVGRSGPERQAPPDAHDSIPIIQQVTIRSEFSPISFRLVIGVVLICAGLLFLPFALSASHRGPMYTCLILSGTFALCGVFALLFRNFCIPCGWVLLGALSLYVFGLTHWEKQPILLLIVFLCLCGMLLWTVLAHRWGRITVPGWLWCVGGLILTGLLILFCMNYIPSFWIVPAEHAAVSS